MVTPRNSANRFNGFPDSRNSNAKETVETVQGTVVQLDHRAEAAVRIRAGQAKNRTRKSPIETLRLTRRPRNAKSTWHGKVLMDVEQLKGGFSLGVLLVWGMAGLLWAYAALNFAGYLKTRAGLRTGYTRKIFHVLIFLSAAVVNAAGGFPAVCAFGITVSAVIAYALARGPGNHLYEAMAREQDSPHRTYYIIVPYFATLIGGVTSNLLFGPFAVIGYLVGGLGDAAGEPAGTRWGRNRYSIGPALSTKSLEGSLAVLTASLIALFIGVAISSQLHFDLRAALVLPLIAIVCTFVEAFSPRGWDNVPMQIVPTLLVVFLLAK